MSARAVPPRSARWLVRLAGTAAFSFLIPSTPVFALQPSEWKALVNRAEQAADERRWDAARAFLEDALRRAGDGPGVDVQERAGALASLAAAHHALAELDPADDSAKRAYRLAQSGVIPDLGVMGRARRTRGDVALDRGRPDEAIDHYQRALVLLEDAVGREHPHVAAAASQLGRLYLDLSRPEKAVPLLQRARAIRLNVPTSDPLALARLDLDLGHAYTLQSDPEHALEHYAEALPALERWSTPSVDLALAFETAAVQSRKLGRIDQAERLYSRSAALLEAELGEDHPRVANALHGLAVLAHDRDDGLRARALFARCVQIWERAPEPKDARLEPVRDLIAELDASLPPVAARESGREH